MKKEKDIIIRVSEDLKQSITQKAVSLGFSASSYIRSLIIKDLKI